MVLLKRALKLASVAQQQAAVTARAASLSMPVWLYVDILNAYALYFKDGNPQISRQVLQVGLVLDLGSFMHATTLLSIDGAQLNNNMMLSL